jgi:hypothetical protein
MPLTAAESRSYTFTEKGEDDMPLTWRVTTTVARERDLCGVCRRKVVAEGAVSL